jgi:hypothetical protein
MVLYVCLATNCEQGSLRNKNIFFHSINSYFFSVLTPVQVVDPLPLYRDFSDIADIT